MICNECNNDCHCKKECKDPCGCAEPVFSQEAMPDDPTIIRTNVNGKSVWYDYDSLVRAGETATTMTVDAVQRTLNHHGEKSDQTISAKELGAILHLADLEDVDANSIGNYGILNYRKNTNCPEGCEGTNNKWRADNPIDLPSESLDYILGSDSEGRLESLAPPANSNKFSYLAWAGADKMKYVTPREAASIPNDGTYEYPVYLDPDTRELVVVKRSIQ